MSESSIVERVQKVPAMWWGAVAGAAAAGATIFPDARVIAALALGGGMLALAVKLAVPCCSDCAEAAAARTAEMRATQGIAVGEPSPSSGGLDELKASASETTEAVGNLFKRALTASSGKLQAGGGCS